VTARILPALATAALPARRAVLAAPPPHLGALPLLAHHDRKLLGHPAGRAAGRRALGSGAATLRGATAGVLGLMPSSSTPAPVAAP